MKRVLLPIDGSDCSLRALTLLLEKRARYRTPEDLDIHLVNVQAPLSHDVTRFASHDQVAEFHREQSEKAMHGARQLLDAAKAAHTCHHLVGSVADEICQLAETLQCDQIVMGTHGRGALQELLMGSITTKVIHLSKIPILLVK